MAKKHITDANRRNLSLNEWKGFFIQKYPGDLVVHFLELPGQNRLITKDTPIGSMGSCFAGHISKYLLDHNYNYIVTELPFREDIFCAHWGSVLNPTAIRQIFQYSLDNFHPLQTHWVRYTEEEKELWEDPFRAGFVFPPHKYQIHINNHRLKSNEALCTTDVFVLTLGLIEVWKDCRDGSVFARVPPKEHYDPNIHQFHIMTVQECYNELEYIHKLLKQYNPKCSIILSISPVPLKATFRNNMDVVSASIYSKSVLRVAAEMLVNQHTNVYYFPSFEFVTYAYQSIGGPWIPGDTRHINKQVINTMMKFFLTQFG